MDRMTKKLEFGGYKRNCENCPYYEECETEGTTCEDFMFMKLGELEDKIENGTLVELPRIIHPNKAEWYVQYQYPSGVIQYDICFTKAEAEAKLKELKDV